MNPQRGTPAGGPGGDSLGAESESNSRSDLAERKAKFVEAMYRYVPEDARILWCQFPGDPNNRKGWQVIPLNRNERRIDPRHNIYFTISAFNFRSDIGWRRRGETFAGGVLLMIDDLGTGPGSKFPLSKIGELPPTALIETSPKNFQAIYMFNRLVTDQAEFNALIDAFVRETLLAQDPGMKGVTRVFRPPFGRNGKPKYGGWDVQLTRWAPECRYSVNEIVDAFGLDLRPEPCGYRRQVAHCEAADWLDAFEAVWEALQQLHMVRAAAPRGDWWDIYCPWEDEHSDGDRTGAAIAFPNAENRWHGGFRCHHGHGDRTYTLRDLTDWLVDQLAGVLDEVNRAAPVSLEFLEK